MNIGTLDEHLCIACGHCCNGTIFKRAVLAPEDTTVPRGAVVAYEEGEALNQPCPHYCGSCTIYERRPTACRSYACKLLKDHLSGRVDAQQAHQRVEELRGLADALREQLNVTTESLYDAVAQFSREVEQAEDPPAFWRANGDTLLTLGAFKLTLRTHFGVGEQLE